jgi:hypothetical protein
MSRKAQKSKSVHNSSMFSRVPDVLPEAHTCEWPDCEVIGEHRAPRSRDDLNNFRWFCMDHIRQYNKSWNYYEGMSDKQVEADLRDDTSWNRPSWPFAGMEKPLNFKSSNPGMDDFSGAFSQSGDPEPDSPSHPRHEPDSREAEAMAMLDLTPPITMDQIKRRYKELVKRHHPDANGGDKAAEEKFKQISLAYATLTSEPLSS